jgi:hypothetical protein
VFIQQKIGLGYNLGDFLQTHLVTLWGITRMNSLVHKRLKVEILVKVTHSVTRLGWVGTLGSFFNYRSSPHLWATFDKNGSGYILGYILGDYFTNFSGHRFLSTPVDD